MQPNILLNADTAILHWIEFVAGTSNDIILSRDTASLAKAMLKEAEQRPLAKEGSPGKDLRIERLRVALAPHKKVPAEILNSIFRYTSMILCVCAYSLEYEPLTLSHVCSRWRTICRSEPSFWNRAFFRLGSRENDLALVKFWMDNFVVDSHPLSLSIKVDWRELYRETLQFLLSQHRLIRHLEIDQVEHFLEMPMNSFPLLEDLHIPVSRNHLLAFERSPCFVGMENLRNFTVRFGCPINKTMLTQRTLPWGHLTSLTIKFGHKRNFLTIPQAVELLQQCTSLQKCNISVANASTPSSLTVHLPHLTYLHFVPHQYVSDNVFSLMHCLVTPMLKSLTVCVVMPETSYNQPATAVNPDIGDFVSRSGCSLHTLILREYTALLADVDLELELLSNLRTLEAPAIIFSDETINRITQGILLPNIQTLTIAVQRIESLDHLTKLVETKCSALPTVSRILCLTVELLQPPEVIAEKQPYISECLKRIEAYGSELALRFKD